LGNYPKYSRQNGPQGGNLPFLAGGDADFYLAPGKQERDIEMDMRGVELSNDVEERMEGTSA